MMMMAVVVVVVMMVLMMCIFTTNASVNVKEKMLNCFNMLNAATVHGV